VGVSKHGDSGIQKTGEHHGLVQVQSDSMAAELSYSLVELTPTNWETRSELHCDGIGYLAPSARSNPTAFQAVRFQPPDPRENREDDGIQA
jgi:hypothetical protein